MATDLVIRVFDVEHGACAMLVSPNDRLAMIDCGHNETTGWRPSTYIRYTLNRTLVDYLFVTNADQDHLSDLAGLSRHGVGVGTLVRNGSPGAPALRILKEINGTLTDDIECFLEMHAGYNGVAVPFNLAMGGVTCSTFCNGFPSFMDTNNLSMATFIKFGAFKMLFPGDLERGGWLEMLKNPAFVAELYGTDIVVASHHGRATGFCEEVFDLCKPQAIVISDKPIEHETQLTLPDYRAVVTDAGIPVVNRTRNRHVLTTRRDGDIIFRVTPGGLIYTATEASWSSLKVA